MVRTRTGRPFLDGSGQHAWSAAGPPTRKVQLSIIRAHESFDSRRCPVARNWRKLQGCTRHATGRSTLPRASSGLRDGRKGNCFLLRCGPAPECRRPSHQAAFAFQKVERRPDRYCSRSTRPLILNATVCQLPVNRPLTSSYAHRRRSAPDSWPAIRHRIMPGRRFVAAAAVRRGGSLRRTAPARSARSEGSAGPFRCPRPEAAASWREDRYSRTGPCRRPPGP